MIDLNKFYLHSIGRGYADNENAGIKLKSILTNGGIYSRRLQLEKLKRQFYKDGSTNWNGTDYISISKFSNFDSRLKSDDYTLFHLRQYSIIISSEIEQSLLFRTGEFQHMDTEFQVRDNIPARYLVGLMMPHAYDRDDCLLDIKRNDNVMSENLIELLKRRFKNSEYMYRVIDSIGISFQIYNEANGVEIPVLEREMQLLKSMSKKH